MKSVKAGIEGLPGVLAVILGGGRGNQLFPLTAQRSEPAVPIAGKYRLIDIPVSNCINSGVQHIAVLTQYSSVSLHRHIADVYKFDVFHSGGVEIWAAEQTIASEGWYEGTADAVRKHLYEIRSSHAENVLILAGDHLYRMNYAEMIRFHQQSQADITLAGIPVSKKDYSRFGILKRDDSKRVTHFVEKPQSPDMLKKLISRDDEEKPYIGSMGIYLFKTSTLIDLLEKTDHMDFGAHIIPKVVNKLGVYSFDFNDYWEDIGTIRSFYDTHLTLTHAEPPFSFFDPDHPIYCHASSMPSSVVENSVLERVLITEGCVIRNAKVFHSVIGLRTQLGDGVTVVDSIVMGADYYQHPEYLSTPDMPHVGIGAGSYIQGAIIDKNVMIGRNVVIRPFPAGTDIDNETWHVRDGIVILPKGVIIAPGTHIAP